MGLGWKKTEKSVDATRRFDASRAVIGLHGIYLRPSFINFSAEIRRGDWVFLLGPNTFAKTLFCDLCFGYVQPESGVVNPALHGSDVSFFGNPNATYGQTLVEHLSCGVKDRSRRQMEATVRGVFGPHLRSLLCAESLLAFREEKNIADLDLRAKDYLEIAEANLLLQNRGSVIVDATSKYYRQAVKEGFTHSPTLLSSSKTIFWILAEESLVPFSEARKVSLFFPAGSPTAYIN